MLCSWKNSGACLKIFKAIQHTNPMVNVMFDEDGAHIMTMDTSKTSLIKLNLATEYFQDYRCNTKMTLGVYTETLVNILQKVKKDQLVWKATDNILTIVVQATDQKTEFNLRAIDIEEDHLDIPELVDDVSVVMHKDSVKDVMDKILMGKTDMTVNIQQQKLKLSSESTEFGKIVHTETIGGDRVQLNDFKNAVDIMLSFHAVKSLFTFSSCGEGPCFLGFSNAMPSRLRVELGTNSYLCLYVAPKIIED